TSAAPLLGTLRTGWTRGVATLHSIFSQTKLGYEAWKQPSSDAVFCDMKARQFARAAASGSATVSVVGCAVAARARPKHKTPAVASLTTIDKSNVRLGFMNLSLDGCRHFHWQRSNSPP